MGGGFGKALCAGKENQWPETVSVSIRLDHCPFQKKVVNLPLSNWLINPLGSGVVSVAQCWSHCWPVSHSATATARSALAGESPCIQPMHSLHLRHHDHLFVGPLGKGKDGEREKLTVYRVVIRFAWLLNASADVTFWWASTWGISIFIAFAHLQRSPDVFLINFSNHVLCRSLITQPVHWPQPMNH